MMSPYMLGALAFLLLQQSQGLQTSAQTQESASLAPEGQRHMSTCLAATAVAANESYGVARTLFSQGLSLPYDAGKYEMCLAARKHRYFLTRATVPLPSSKGSSKTVPLTFEVGLCLPDECSRADAKTIIHAVAKQSVRLAGSDATPSSVTALSPQLDLKRPGRGSAAAVAVLCALAFLVLWASCTQSRGSQPLILEAFAATGPSGSWAKLWECQARGGLDCMNGMRVLSMFWVVIGHSFLYVMDVTGGFANQEDIYKNPLNPNAVERYPPGLILIFNGQVSVDTFLLISGLLQGIHGLEMLHNSKDKLMANMSVGSLAHGRMMLAGVAQRYLRLTPSVVLVWLMYHFCVPYLARGPFAARLQDQILSRCDHTWWASFLHVQAVFPMDKDQMCMKWTWYLSCDMMYFIVALVVLPLHLHKPTLLWLVLTALLAGSLAIGTVLANRYPLELDPSWVHSAGWGAVYVNPLVRFVPYVMGLAAGILEWRFYDSVKKAEGGAGAPQEVKDGRKESKEAWAVQAAAPKVALDERPSYSGWLLFVVSLAALVAAVLLPQTDLGDTKDSWFVWEMTLYTVASRPVWALACTYIILFCRRYQVLVAAFLAHPAWTPMARLTYGAYLAHPLIIKLSAARHLQFYTFSACDYLQHVIANTTLAYGASILLWMLAERPVMVLASSALRGRPKQAEPVGKKASSGP